MDVMTPLTEKQRLQNNRSFIALAVISILISTATLGLTSYIISKSVTSTPTISTYGFVDNSQKSSHLVASSPHQQVYELSINNNVVGIRRRYLDNSNNYCDVDFITGDVNIIPFAGELSGSTRQYTMITLSNGDKLTLIPYNYIQYVNNFVNSTTNTMMVIYNGVISTIIVNRNQNGGFNGLSLDNLDPAIETFLKQVNNILNYARADPPLTQSSEFMVNPVCVIMKCGISGAIDIATCAVEITGSAGTFGWIICAGQSVLAGCNCLECWGYCNMG
jgi:hypothetical protein